MNQSGLLEPMELCRALRELGFAFDAFEVANWRLFGVFFPKWRVFLGGWEGRRVDGGAGSWGKRKIGHI